MNPRSLFVVLVASTCFCGASAYSQVPEICNAALSSGVRDNYYVLTEREQYEFYHDRLCKAKFASYQDFQSQVSSFKLDLPLAEGLLGLGGSSSDKSAQFSQSYDKYCHSTLFSGEYRDRFVSYTNRVSVALADNWLECQKTHVAAWLEVNKKGVLISVATQANFSEFTVTVNRKGSVQTRPVVVNNLSPANAFQCTRGATSFGAGSEVDLNEFQFSCVKPEHRPISFSIDTNDGVSNTVVVPASTSRIQELNDKIAAQASAMQREIEALRAELRRSAEAVASIGSGTLPVPATGSRSDPVGAIWTGEGGKWWLSCPTGYYVGSIGGYDSDPGRHCSTCISRLGVVCLPIVKR